MGYEWRFDVVWKHLRSLLGGIQVTLSISIVSLIIATIIGLLVAILRLQKKKLLDIPTLIYIDFFRTTPPLVQLIWIYYCVPILFGIELSAYWSGVLTLGLNTGAFMAEIFRAGILAVEKGQMEAARVLGMSYTQALRRIVIPQALICMLPPLGNILISTIKVSSLVSIIAVPDLLHRATLMSAITFRPLEFLTVVAVIYFVITYPISPLILRLQKMVGVGDHL